MFIFITTAILFIASIILLFLRFASPNFRYTWLFASGSSLLALISVLFWQIRLPELVALPLWKPENLFQQSPHFIADGISWVFALSIVTICSGVIITSVARDNFPTPISWIGILMLSGLGVLAVTADNPLTLVLLWAAIDLTEATTQLRFVDKPKFNEQVVTSFFFRMCGTLILLWASMVSTSGGSTLDFLSAPPRAGLFLVLAAGFRLGVLPLHLPFSSESTFRRGFGTALRVISAGSSLILLARIPLTGIDSPLTPYLLFFISIAALYGGWMWLRSPDELVGRPFWLIGVSALAIASSLRGNPIGAAAWSCGLILAGSALFLASAQNRFVDRYLFVGVWGISALPFSTTATGWVSQSDSTWLSLPPTLLAQTLLIAGYIRFCQRSTTRSSFENQPIWAINVYPIGIVLILSTMILIGLFGWEGGLQFGNWIPSILTPLLTALLLWLVPRVRILNPIRIQSEGTTQARWAITANQLLWNIYFSIRRFIHLFTGVVEGQGGIMLTFLFLALLLTVFAQGTP